MKQLLETKGLCKTYDNERGISDISFSIEEGDIYGFLGPNGSGKTTTIRCILDLIHADQGTVKINGHPITTEFKDAIKNVGAIVETPTFYDYMSGYSNLSLIAKLHKHVNKERILEVLNLVGLKERAKDRVRTYSLGMKQRLGIARALLHHPKLVILDEPTNGLDPQGMKEVRELIKELAGKEKITFFISTHLLNEVEQICNKVGILKEGKMIAEGFVNDLLAEDMETVEVHTNDKKQSLNLVKQTDFIRKAELSSKGVRYQIDKGYSSQLIKFLIKNAIEIDYVIPRNQSLESYFLNIMRGEDEVC